jgi:hypothetical protein
VTLLLKSVVPVWLLAVAGAVVVGVLVAPHDYLVYLPVVLGLATLLTFCIQLGIQKKEGFVIRVSASAAGVVVILAVATLVLAPIALAA